MTGPGGECPRHVAGQPGGKRWETRSPPGQVQAQDGARTPARPGAMPGRVARPGGVPGKVPRPGAVPGEGPPGAQPEEIEGALGRIRLSEEHRAGWRRRLVTFLAIVGPGLIVMAGDNDAGGVSTYAQAGQDYGYSLLWVLILLVPVLIVNQEMVARLGAVTGVGYARLINERFGRFWGWFSVGNLFVLNFLTIITEFIGISLALGYFGVSKYVAAPAAAVLLVAITASGSFRRWERAMLFFIATSLVLIPLALLSHPSYSASAYHLVVPGIQGGATSDAILLIIAIVGTTVAPWQLFFQQSNVIDKRITPRFLAYERADTFLGSIVVVVGAGGLMVIADYAVRGTPLAGHFTDALGVAEALGRHSTVLGALFSIVLLDASIIGAAAVTLSTSYAFGDMFGVKHSLHRSFRDARPFYASYAALVVVAAATVLIPGAPLGLITTAVQALAGILLPSATVFLLLLCNDPQVLGPWVNPRWLNVAGGAILGSLLVLSGTLVVSTAFPLLNVGAVAAWLAVALAAGVAIVAAWLAISRARHGPTARPAPVPRSERSTWRMPPVALLKPVTWSPATRLAMIVLSAYLAVSVLLLIVKAAQLGGG